MLLRTLRPATFVPLSTIVSVSGHFGLANRDLQKAEVEEKKKNWSDVACGVLTVFQETPGGLHILMSGHHRHAAMMGVCMDEGLRPEDFLVQVQIYTPADAKVEGLTVSDFVRKYVELCNQQREQMLMDTLQQTQDLSPWVREFRARGITVHFNGNKKTDFNYAAILRAYISVMKAVAAVKEGRPPVTVLSAFRINGTDAEMLQAYHNPDRTLVPTICEALEAWGVPAEALRRPDRGIQRAGVNLFTRECLAFVMFANLDPENRKMRGPILRDMPARFINPVKPFNYPAKKKGSPKMSPGQVIGHLLAHANNGRQTANRLTVLGLSEVG